MDDVFFFARSEVSAEHIAVKARQHGWLRVDARADWVELSYDADRLTNCVWAPFNVVDAGPEEGAELEADGIVCGWCVSHHPGNNPLFSLLKALCADHDGWVGNDDDGFQPRFDAANLEDFRYR